MDQPLDPFKHLVTVFLTLFYTSPGEIPILLHTSSLKMVPLSGGASPYSPLITWSTQPVVLQKDHYLLLLVLTPFLQVIREQFSDQRNCEITKAYGLGGGADGSTRVPCCHGYDCPGGGYSPG